MLLRKETDYGIRGLLNLASSEDEYKSVRKIAEEEDIPYIFLRRIFNKLKAAGYIITREGSSGGASISRPPEEVNLGDLALSIQGEVGIIGCNYRGKPCKNRPKCRVRRKLKCLENSLISELKNISLKEFLNE